MGRGSDADRIEAFWEAVATTSETFVADMVALQGSGSTEEFEKISSLLQAVHPDLLLVLGGHRSARPEVVVSAGGIRAAYAAVRKVADAAPPSVTARYDVRAFRPRVPRPEDLRVRAKGKSLRAADIRWDVRRDRRDRTRCNLTLYVPGFIDSVPADSIANRSLAESVFLLLDHLVGEWAVGAQIGVIDWRSTADAAGLPSLVELPAYLDKIAAE